MIMKDWTFSDEEMKAIDKYLRLCVTRNEKCKTCLCRHTNNSNDTEYICYFSAGCFLNSQCLYAPKKS